jgi:hypothetical protein
MVSPQSLRQFGNQLAVIPSHRDLFGREARLDEVIALLKKYPVSEWLSYLARIQNVLAGKQAEQGERMRHVFYGTVSWALRARLEQFERQCNGRMLLYYERQMSILQELAVLHAPEEGTTHLDNEEGLHDLSMALLMTTDIMGADRPLCDTIESLLPVLVQEQIRMSMTPSLEYAARAFHFYQFAQGQQNAEVLKYLEMFQIATGVSAVDCMLGGLDIVAREEVLTADQLAKAWYRVPREDQADNPKEAVVWAAYEAVHMRRLADLRSLIHKWEDGRPVRDWNLIALSQAPLCDLGESGAFVLNHTVLGRSLFDSVRHAILTAALEKHLPAPYDNKQAVGGLYGKIFESYVFSVFKSAYGERVLSIPEDNRQKRADLLIWFPDKVLIVEVKGVHFVGCDHSSFMSIDERRKELEEVGMARAVDQLASTTRLLRAGEIMPASMPSYDWTITPIIPVIVTEEQMPQVPGCWDLLYDPLCAELNELTGAGPLGRLRLLTVADAERLPDLRASDDLATMLIRWGANQSLRDLTWSSFLATKPVSFLGSFMVGRFIETLKFLARRLGLDEAKLGVPAKR